MKNIKYEQAVEMRLKGMTLQAIGDIFEVTRERARQMVLVGQRMREERSAWYAGLSVRAVNALVKRGCNSKQDVRELLKSPSYLIEGMPGVGVKTKNEIVIWVHQ